MCPCVFIYLFFYAFHLVAREKFPHTDKKQSDTGTCLQIGLVADVSVNSLPHMLPMNEGQHTEVHHVPG